jgi:putative two-component system response regulator
MSNEWYDLYQITVLIVDDDSINRIVASTALKQCTLLEAKNGQMALDVLAEHDEIDVVLLDVMMPGIDGYEICKRIKANPRWRFIPVIMLTALNDVESRVSALSAGADDFISKPFNILELRARVYTSARAKRYFDQLEDTKNILFTLANVVESKDAYTNGHLQRIADMTNTFCRALHLSPREEQFIHYGGLLHDIGKVAISDAILTKPARLSAAEFEIIKTHPVIGSNIVSSLRMGKQVSPIVRGHHERWNGTGYPDQLKGEEIPLGARVIGICDVFDALTTDRPYRQKITHREALAYIQEQAGIHFDAHLVTVFGEFMKPMI